MADAPDRDQQTEAPTDKRRRDAAEKGDVLQSRELATALVMLAGAGWMAIAGPWMLRALADMLGQGLRFDVNDIDHFDPATAAFRMIATVAFPLGSLFLLTVAAAIGGPAILGSFGFRWGAVGFKPDKLNPITGLGRIFGRQGLIELIKSIAKIAVLGGVGWWLFRNQSRGLTALGHADIASAIGQIGQNFVIAVVVMSLGLAAIAAIDVPAQIIQRGGRLRMSKQEVKDEHKQSEGSPEMRAALRRRQHQVLKGSARQAVAQATVVLTNPTEFAVALRYRPGLDVAPIVVARGRGATAAAIRELADEGAVPVLRYPQLARAIYFTAQTGQIIREDLYLAVATIIAFVFNLETAMAESAIQPDIEVPAEARFDENGQREG
jgi:flagellar biosynthesis protein FlhB